MTDALSPPLYRIPKELFVLILSFTFSGLSLIQWQHFVQSLRLVCQHVKRLVESERFRILVLRLNHPLSSLFNLQSFQQRIHTCQELHLVGTDMTRHGHPILVTFQNLRPATVVLSVATVGRWFFSSGVLNGKQAWQRTFLD